MQDKLGFAAKLVEQSFYAYKYVYKDYMFVFLSSAIKRTADRDFSALEKQMFLDLDVQLNLDFKYKIFIKYTLPFFLESLFYAAPFAHLTIGILFFSALLEMYVDNVGNINKVTDFMSKISCGIKYFALPLVGYKKFWVIPVVLAGKYFTGMVIYGLDKMQNKYEPSINVGGYKIYLNKMQIFLDTEDFDFYDEFMTQIEEKLGPAADLKFIFARFLMMFVIRQTQLKKVSADRCKEVLTHLKAKLSFSKKEWLTFFKQHQAYIFSHLNNQEGEDLKKFLLAFCDDPEINVFEAIDKNNDSIFKNKNVDLHELNAGGDRLIAYAIKNSSFSFIKAFLDKLNTDNAIQDCALKLIDESWDGFCLYYTISLCMTLKTPEGEMYTYGKEFQIDISERETAGHFCKNWNSKPSADLLASLLRAKTVGAFMEELAREENKYTIKIGRLDNPKIKNTITMANFDLYGTRKKSKNKKQKTRSNTNDIETNNNQEPVEDLLAPFKEDGYVKVRIGNKDIHMPEYLITPMETTEGGIKYICVIEGEEAIPADMVDDIRENFAKGQMHELKGKSRHNAGNLVLPVKITLNDKEIINIDCKCVSITTGQVGRAVGFEVNMINTQRNKLGPKLFIICQYERDYHKTANHVKKIEVSFPFSGKKENIEDEYSNSNYSFGGRRSNY